jgi:hypothetical protein
MKHLADHRNSSTGARAAHFLRLARDRSDTLWARVWQKPVHRSKTDRRVAEYVRIARGREV